MSRRPARRLGWLVALAVACAPAPPSLDDAEAAGEPAAAPPAAGEPAAGSVAQIVLREVNAERARRGAEPLVLDPAVAATAGDLARELAAAGGLRRDAVARRGIDADWTTLRLASHDYFAQRMVQGLLQSAAPPREAIADWARSRPHGFVSLLEPPLRHLGVATAEVGGGERLYAMVATLSIDDYFAPAATRLADLEGVRREMADAVARERRGVGLPPLARSRALDRAAQEHAAAMLALGFFAHRSPAGDTVAERVEEQGYRYRRVGENIAQGPRDVATAMEGWMRSPGHRANLLDAGFRELGTGVAHGPVPGGYQVYWVQVLATPP